MQCRGFAALTDPAGHRLVGDRCTDCGTKLAGGWKVELGGGEWMLCRIEDDDQVTVTICHAA